VTEVQRYRAYVDAEMGELLRSADAERMSEFAPRVMLGLHHEQQHQELLLTDVKYNFSINPLRPVYATPVPAPRGATAHEWIEFDAGIVAVGHDGDGFSFDNETPRHRVYLGRHALASRPVTNGEYLEFIAANGYTRAEFWLSDGWRAVCSNQWRAPLYWEMIDGAWWQFTLGGMQPLDEQAPVCHVSLYEADAYARFVGKRLPTEFEWEHAAVGSAVEGNFRESGHLQPIVGAPGGGLRQLYGDVWEWTRSAYAPFPGFRPLAGSLGEYNGKFMCNQMVLRGGSCVTPASHIRVTYRNFFYPGDRWQFSGFRLADDR
jgi:ergothioneine biosynthesis protein EgtB